MKNFSFRSEKVIDTDIILPHYLERVSRIISFLTEEHKPFIPIIKNRKYFGVVTVWDLARLGFSRNTKLINLASKLPMYTIDELDYEEIIKVIAKNKLPGIVVSDRYGRVYGIIKQSDIIQNINTSLFNNVSVGSIISRGDNLFLSRFNKISALKNYFVKNKLEEAYIIGKHLEGFVTIYDILSAISTIYVKRSRRGEVAGKTIDIFSEKISRMTLNFKFNLVSNKSYLSSVLSLFSHFSSIPVKNEKGNILGLVTRYRILKLLSNMYEERRFPIYIKGLYGYTRVFREVIEKKIYESTYSLSKKARILEVKMVVRSSRKSDSKFLYKVGVKIVLDRGIHNGYAEGWNLIATCTKAIDEATRSLIKTRKRIKKKKIRRARMSTLS